jgi:AcrR family transcriptional regulator
MSNERKDEILNIAIKIIDEAGFSALSMKRVGEIAGISEPAVYRYFKSKENLVNEIFNKIISIHKHISEKYEDCDDDLYKIESILLEHLEYYEKNREITALIFSSDAFSYSNRIKNKISPILKERENLMISLIENAQKKGIIKKINPDHLTKMISGSIMLLIVNWRMENFSFSLVEKGKILIDTIKTIIINKDNNL